MPPVKLNLLPTIAIALTTAVCGYAIFVGTASKLTRLDGSAQEDTLPTKSLLIPPRDIIASDPEGKLTHDQEWKVRNDQIKELIKTNPNQAFDWLNRRERQKYAAELLESFAEHDPAQGIKLIKDCLAGTNFRSSVTTFFKSIAAKDLEYAKTLFSEMDPAVRNEEIALALAHLQVKSDPAGTLVWTATLPDHESKKGAIRAIISRIDTLSEGDERSRLIDGLGDIVVNGSPRLQREFRELWERVIP